MRVLVCGGAGFIGSNFIHYLLESFPTVSVLNYDKLTYSGNLDNVSSWANSPRYSFVHGDICDRSLLIATLTAFNPDYLVNFAAETHVDRSIVAPGGFVSTNIVGTFEILEIVRMQWGAHSQQRFLHISTDEVFGSLGPSGYFTEQSPYHPNSPYSASKAAADHLVNAYIHTYGINAVTTNCSNNYGPYQYPEKLIPLMIICGMQGKPMPIYGDGKNVRDWLHVRDHSRALWLALSKGKSGESYAVGGRCEQANIDIVDSLCSVLDRELKLSPERSTSALKTFIQDRPGHDRRYAIDPAKIERELGWHPEISFEQGLAETTRWYIANQPWWQAILARKERLHYYS